MTRPGNRRQVIAIGIVLCIVAAIVAALPERDRDAFGPTLFEEPTTPSVPFFSVSLA